MTSNLRLISNEFAVVTKIAILTHVSPDGDCLGSGIALALALKGLGKEVHVIIDNPLPGSLAFLPGQELIAVKHSEGFEPEMTFAIDCGDVERFQDRAVYFDLANVTVNIDHHRTNKGFATYNYVDCERSSTSELVFELLKEMQVEITKDIAICLYVGLVTDTGGFKYGNTNAKTHLCAAELLGYGLNIAALSQDIFEYSTESMLRLKAKALSSLQLEYDKRLAIVTVSKADFEETVAERSETEGFADLGRSIVSVVASVALREFEKDKIKISMRSKGTFDVAKIAQLFDGGGHINASGCSINATLEDAKAQIIKAFEVLKDR